VCPLLKLGYTLKKKIEQMTAHKYREGESRRLMVGRETLLSKQRAQLPLLIVNLDGAAGHFDENRNYFIKQNVINYLISLSCNFRIAVFTIGTTKNTLRKLCSLL
jgi:hypothetical protein